MSLRIDVIDILDPDRLDLAQRWSDVYVAAQAHLFADGGSPWTLAELQAKHRSPNVRRFAVALRDAEGAVVGALDVEEPLRDNLDSARLMLAVHPKARGRGYGSALLQHAEDLVGGHGRHVLTTESECPVGQNDAAAGFATAHGWAVAQTMPRSVLALSSDDESAARLRALAAGGDGAGDPAAYRIETALDLPPESWMDGLAVLYRAMSTDIPLGDLALEEEDWDAERVRAQLVRLLEAGRRFVTAVSVDRSGDLVGFTELAVSAGSPTVAFQGSTLVTARHRGHRLGIRLKAANALALLEHLPDVRSVRTWNADDNAPILSVNRELGYVVDAWERTWQKRLS